MTVLVARPGARVAQAGQCSGAELWEVACAACHGADRAGRPRVEVGFEVPVPDFRDCPFATAGPTADWFAVVYEVGPVRGLDRIMPAYGAALTNEEIGPAGTFFGPPTRVRARPFLRSRG